MAKKKLILNESVTKRFMKLATIKPTYVSNFLREAEEMEEDPMAEEGEEAPEDLEGEELEDEAMEMDPDMETEDEMEGEGEGDAEGMIEDFIKGAIMPWAEENGVALEVAG